MKVLDYFSLRGKVAIVTGGYGYLGKAFSEALCEAGATVYVAARDKKKFCDAFANKEGIEFLDFDISSTESIKTGFKTVFEKDGHIDILVNNAFYLSGQFPEEITDEDIIRSFDGVAGSVYRCIREILPYMRENKYGSIINIASMYGIVVPDFRMYEGVCKSSFNSPLYGASKASVIQLTKFFAEYLIKDNIRVNAIAPGTYPSTKVQENEEFVKRLSEHNPAGRIGKPEDLKGTLVYLASDASKYLIGQTIQVDGGWTIW